MKHAFRIHGLPADAFTHLTGRSDTDLAALGVVRVVAQAGDALPDRIALRDASPGESLLLLNYTHQPADSPYRSSHAIFVGEHERQTYDRTGEVPESLRDRLLSVRAFDDGGMMRDADVVEGRDLEPLIDRFFDDPATRYLHAHTARRGCFLAAIERARE